MYRICTDLCQIKIIMFMQIYAYIRNIINNNIFPGLRAYPFVFKRASIQSTYLIVTSLRWGSSFIP